MVMRSRYLWPLTLVFVVVQYTSVAESAAFRSSGATTGGGLRSSPTARQQLNGLPRRGPGEILLAAADQQEQM